MTREEAQARARKAKRYLEEIEAEFPSADDYWLDAISCIEDGIRDLEE